MSDGGNKESAMRAVMITFFPMFIATLSLVTSIYNGYLNGRFVDLVQNNVSRVEYMKTCKEIIDGYFQVKLRARLVSKSEAGQKAGAEAGEAQSAAARFAALGTYLANLRNEKIRAEYTELAMQLERLALEAPRLTREEIDKRLASTDKTFGSLNDDCIRSAKAQAM